MYDFYNVSCYTPNPSSLITNVMSRLVNCLVKALNDALKLPRLIVVIPDMDLCNFVQNRFQPNTYDSPHIIREAVFWILNQFARAIESKKDNFMRRKIGAVIGSEPKVIWVKALYRTCSSCYNRDQCEHFNNELEDLLHGRDCNYILSLNRFMDDDSFFDQRNNLTGLGRIDFSD